MYHVGNLVKELTEKHGRTRESLMPILQGIVRKHNYLTDEAMVEVAKELEDVKVLSRITFNACSVYFASGEWERKVDVAHTAIRLIERTETK